MEEEVQPTPSQNTISPEQQVSSESQQPQKKSHKWLIITIISIVALVIIIGVIVLVFSGDKINSEEKEVLEQIKSELSASGYSSQEVAEVTKDVSKESVENGVYCGSSTLEASGNIDRISFSDDKVLLCMGKKIVAGCENAFMFREDGGGKFLYEITGGENHLCDIRITTIGGWLLDGEKVWNLEGEDFDGVPINNSMTNEELARLPLRPF